MIIWTSQTSTNFSFQNKPPLLVFVDDATFSCFDKKSAWRWFFSQDSRYLQRLANHWWHLRTDVFEAKPLEHTLEIMNSMEISFWYLSLEVQSTKQSGWSLGWSMDQVFPILIPMGKPFGQLGLTGNLSLHQDKVDQMQFERDPCLKSHRLQKKVHFQRKPCMYGIYTCNLE